MSVVLTIASKEIHGYFKSYMAYILLGVYLLISMGAVFYSAYFFEYNNRNLISFFIYQPNILNILLPAVTMKVWAEEKRYGTLEFLLTQPVSYKKLVLGKFLAAWSFSVLMLLMTIPFAVYSNFLIPLDLENVCAAYVAEIIVMGAFCALGCLISACNSNVIIAYLTTVLGGWVWQNVNFNAILYYFKNLFPMLKSRLDGVLNFSEYYQQMIQGQMGIETIVYFGGIIFFALWLNIIIIGWRKG